ncbi:diguanylate cyclase (GGDEF) domain-containing protein [Duganella sp. CF517]|uniref:GGDEF domain-containing protein n=1 Tax=Duganella sp. CF517 TaxID=1881038 RepID=UPI0008C8A6F7|nr:GGDEF domain-containing protein [Duganella sp. CF517]SEN79728.1 diguanylate cyclase (GGDEF) domain-containing protein [Duganella sp. CF517]
MRKLFAYSYFIGDPEQQRQFFVEGRPIVILTQAFGLIAWLCAITLLFGSNGDGLLKVTLGAPGIVASLLLTIRARSLRQLIISGVLGAVSTAIAFRLFLDQTEQPVFWVLPIGIAMALAAAPVFSGLINYVATVVVIWLVLGVGNFPGQPGQLDFNLALVAVCGSLCIGVYLNIFFLALRVGNFRARKELTVLAFKDSLTGLDNRRKFTLDARAAQQTAGSLHFLMIDIDDFKKINDTLGHDAGDEVLKKTAAVIGNLSAGHLCGRLGGEEFGVVFHGELAEACAFAGRMLDEVRAACVPARTISIGIAAFDKQADLSVSYRHADRALYSAKHAGKNRYVVAADQRVAAA